jgi:hypothetical protein
MYKRLFIFFVLFPVCFSGCSFDKKEIKNVDNTAPLRLSEMQIMGYWMSPDSANNTYEFFSAETEDFNLNPTELKTGRILHKGTVLNQFYWNIENDGSLNLHVVDSKCNARPLTSCELFRSEKIVVRGSLGRGTIWAIELDSNSDGVVDNLIEGSYQKKSIDPSLFPSGEFFLNYYENFSVALRGNIESKKLTIEFPGVFWGVTPLSDAMPLVADLPKGKIENIEFKGGVNTAVKYKQQLNVNGIGATEFVVKMWYDRVVMFASEEGKYSITYDVFREVQVPAGMNPDLIDQSQVPKHKTEARVVNLIDKFIAGKPINAGETFYSLIKLDFNLNLAGDGGGNKIVFLSDGKGKVYRQDLYKNKYSEMRDFSWQQDADGAINLTFPGLGQGVVRFIKAIGGGYQVLFDLPITGSERRRYFVHDWIKDEGIVDMSQFIPGHFIVGSNDGTTFFEVIFHHDHKVSVSVEGVEGYWFKDSDGSIMSYQCIDLQERPVTGYDECYSMFEHVGSENSKASYAHIRRIAFLHHEGNEFSAAYDASVWGGLFGIVEREYMGFNWTYRWRRVGDAPIQ